MEPHIRKRATLADLEALPEGTRAELIDGELFVFPAPIARHSRVSVSLARQIGGPFDQDANGPGGWWIFSELEILLGSDVFVPDASGWRRERVPEFPDVKRMTLPPDWVCEVLSPGNARHDRRRKMPLYLKAGIPFAWLVDPDTRLLDAYTSRPDGWLHIGTWDDEDVARIPPFDAIEIAVATLLPPRPPDLVHDAV